MQVECMFIGKIVHVGNTHTISHWANGKSLCSVLMVVHIVRSGRESGPPQEVRV